MAVYEMHLRVMDGRRELGQRRSCMSDLSLDALHQEARLLVAKHGEALMAIDSEVEVQFVLRRDNREIASGKLYIEPEDLW